MPLRFLLIRNPAAGRGRALKLWPGFTAQLAAGNLDFDEISTGKPGDALEFAETRGKDYGCVVAVGGDGTVHEVANGLMRAGAPAALGVLPCGSGDDFAKMLAPGDPVARLAAGRMRPYDIGHVEADGNRYFINGMDIGFGAHGARNITRVPPFLTGLGAYLGALVLTLVRYPKLNVRIRLDDAPPFRLRTAMTAIMNGVSFGGSFRVTPEAKGDDGFLDLLMVDAVGRLGILGLVPLIMLGRHAWHPRLRMTRVRRVLIEAGEPLDLELDGELPLPPSRRIAIEILPGALRVMG
ncbi:MAG: diacylglycerol/lipid kinase family protein [Betaproteobacteria bacterium]